MKYNLSQGGGLMYCAIIGDIVDSRKMEERDKVQIRLHSILKEVNQKYIDDIASKFVLTLGDEFQGLLKTPRKVLEMIDYIKMKFYPDSIRFGIGLGSIDTEINSEAAIGADGHAYYAARKAIETVKTIESSYKNPERDIMFIHQSNSKNESLELVNATLSMCFIFEEKWTVKQRETIWEMAFFNKTQSDMAREWRLSRSSIQRRLDKANYLTYLEAKKALQNRIMTIWEDDNEQ
jgi:hypothetical protein